MRGQPGTSDLRTLVYMDEVYGFVPPTAMPPAKKPILTILKQGRAFGVGMALATQNPVDLDYKAMANAGTWLVGRLQTENDKARVMEGLRSASGDAEVEALGASIGGLEKREFMLVSAKASEPVLFQTRWAMSYLRGPLTKDQISTLMAKAPRPVRSLDPAAAATAPAPSEAPPRAQSDAETTPVAPPVAGGVQVAYLDPAAPWAEQVGAVPGATRFRAFLAARVGVAFDDVKAQVDERQEYEALYPLHTGLDLDASTAVDYDDRDFVTTPPEQAAYFLPSAPIGEPSFFRSAERDIARRLVETQALELRRNAQLKLTSRPGETPEQFAARCDEAAQAAADAEAAKLKQKLEARQAKLENALELAQRRVEEVTIDERTRQTNELVAGAGAVLGALLGGRRSTRSIATALGSASSRRGASTRSAERKRTAEAKAEQVQDDLVEIEQRILDEVQEIDARWTDVAARIETIAIRPEATDVRVERLMLVWVPTL